MESMHFYIENGKLNGFTMGHILKDKKEQLWLKCMKLGAASGCHQRAERSFFYRKYQFPVCARCTGIFVGYILSFVTYSLYIIPTNICMLLIIPMILDGVSQYFKLRDSNNILRVISGFLGGFGIMRLWIWAIFMILRKAGVL